EYETTAFVQRRESGRDDFTGGCENYCRIEFYRRNVKCIAYPYGAEFLRKFGMTLPVARCNKNIGAAIYGNLYGDVAGGS
ncbi:hypothetical protein OFC08_34585, partial [Escherichia coli]|nr:hypothetical protein [Escherichia coli]